jgi:tetratricopeptide (TPR) repeat protein
VAAQRAPVPPPVQPETRRKVDAAREQLARASALGLAGKYADGLVAARAALAEATPLHYPPIEAEAHLRIGSLQGARGEYAPAAESLYRSYEAAVAGRHDGVAARASIELVRVTGDWQNHYEEADRWARIAAASLTRIGDNGALLGELLMRRSGLRVKEGRYDDAIVDAKAGVEAQTRALGPADPGVADALQALGGVQYHRYQYPEALASYERALAIKTKALGPDHPDVARATVGIADVYGDTGQHERALTLYQNALEAYERIHPDHPGVAATHSSIGYELRALHRLEESKGHFERALASFQRQLGPSYEVVKCLYNLGDVMMDWKRYGEALPYFEKASDMCAKVLGESHMLCPWPLAGLANAHEELRQYDEALAYAKRAIAAFEKTPDANTVAVTLPLHIMGETYLRRGEAARALPPLERAIHIMDGTPGVDVDAALIRFTLGRALWANGERARAVELVSKSRDVYAGAGPSSKDNLVLVTTWLQEHHP